MRSRSPAAPSGVRTIVRGGIPAWLIPVALLLAAPGMPSRGADGPAPESTTGPQPPAPRQIFEANRGQADLSAAFVSRCDGFVVRLDPGGIDLIPPGRAADRDGDVARLTFLGARTSTVVGGIDPLPRRVNYLEGPDPRGWIRGVPAFSGVRYSGLYPGIDLIVGGDYRRLVLEFVLEPEADAHAIAFGVEGPGRLAALDPPGDAGPERRIRFSLERAQAGPGERGGPDDPVARVAVDGEGNHYVAGRTLAVGAGDAEAFVARFDGDGASGFTTYFGGDGEDVPLGLAVGADGGVVLAGFTRSGNFPLARALQPERSGPTDAFVLSLAADGSTLVYSTYLGGDGDDEGRAVALDARGAAWIAGRTGEHGVFDAFLAALEADGAPLLRATIPGGGAGKAAAGAIAVDATGPVWVAGDGIVATLLRDGGATAGEVRLGGGGDDAVGGLALDPSGRVFAAGSDASGEGYLAVLSAGDDGAITVDRVGRLGGTGRDRLLGVVAGDDATAWVAGWTERVRPDGTRGRTPLVVRVGAPADGVDRFEVSRHERASGAGDDETLPQSRLTGIALDSEDRPIVAGIEAAGGPHAARVIEAAASGGLVFVGPALDAAPDPEAAGCPGTIIFDNGAGSGLWQNALNWSTDVLPAPADDVCIPAGMNVTLGSGTHLIGTLFVETGASLALAGGSLSVAGASQVEGGFTFSGGTLTGAGEININGPFIWTGGTMSGTGSTHANGGIAFSGAGVKDLSGGRVLNTAGTTTWTGGSVRPGSGAVIRNGGLWDVQGDTSMVLLGGATPRFDNLAGATFRKSAGAGTMSTNVPFTNAGALEVLSGTIAFSGGGSGAGTFTGSAGTALAFTGSTYSLLSGSSLEAPTVSVGNASTLDVSGTYNVSGTTTVTGTGVAGIARFNPAATVISLGSTVTLGLGTLDLNSGEAIALTALSLTASGSSLRGSDTVTVSSPMAWSAGSMSGTGTTNAGAGITFSGSAVKDITGGRMLNTAGTTTWVGGSVRPGSGAVIRNSGVWEAQGDTSMTFLGGAAPRFDNLAGATFRKTGGTGAMTSNVAFNNAGAVTALLGTISLGGGGSGAGTFSASPGAALAFAGGTYTLLDGATVDAPTVAIETSGTLILSEGASLDAATVVVGHNSFLDVSGTYHASSATNVPGGTGFVGTARFNPAATVVSLGTDVTLGIGILELNTGGAFTVTRLALTAQGASLRGGDTVTVTDPITWTGGSMSGTGTTHANGGIAFSGTAVKDVSGGRIVNTAGTTTWAGGPVRPGSGAVIRNSGLWDVQGDPSMSFLGGSAPRFENLEGATFLKSAGAGTMDVDVTFNNAGTLSVQIGTASLSAGGTGSGTFSAAPGAALAFNGGTYTLSSGSVLDAPAVSVGNATVLDVSGTFTVSATTTVTGTGVPGVARFNPAATVLGLGTDVMLPNGILELNSGEPIGMTTLSLTSAGSSLRGTDTVTVTGPINWIAGNMTGTGTTHANGGIVFSGAAVKDISGGRIVNTAGTTTWTGGPVRPGSGAVIRNSGLWDVQGDTSMSFLGGAAPRFDNLAGGTFQKSSGTGTTSSNVAFTNAGAVRVLAGTLSFTAGYTQSAGSTTVEGATIASSTPLGIQGGSLGGVGTVAAAVTSAGRLAPGLSPGALSITGTYAQSAAGSYDVEIGGLAPGAGHDAVAISGAAGLAGTLDVSLANGFSPADHDTFTIMTFPSSTGAFAAANLPPLGGDLVWKIHHNPTSIVLEVLADLDGDGVRNSSDCAPDDPTVWAAPAEVAGSGFAAGGQTFSWTSLATQAGPATTYDVVRGLIAELPAGGGAAETCLAPGIAAGQVTDSADPEVRAGFYYLVRGRNVCGVGTYGESSSGVARLTSVCP